MPPFRFNLPTREAIRNSPNGRQVLRFIELDDPNSNSILVTGCPGCGKTTLSIYRLIRLCNQGRRAILFTYQHMLRIAIRNLAGTAGVSPNHVWTIKKWYSLKTGGQWLHFDRRMSAQDIIQALEQARLRGDEIILDEGQDLPRTVYESFPRFFNRVTVGADDAQRVHEQGADIATIRNCLQQRGVLQECPLQYNYRNSFEIFDFARQFVPNDPRAADNVTLERLQQDGGADNDKPCVYLYQTAEQQNDRLRRIVDNAAGNVALLCTKADQVNDYTRRLRGMGFDVSSYTSRDYRNPPAQLENIVVTTYISAKGMEFDAVIIPEFNFWKDISSEWFVACTRAIRELHIFCRGANLPRPICGFREDTYEGPLNLAEPVVEEIDNRPF